MLISLLLQLHLERKKKPPKCEVASVRNNCLCWMFIQSFQMHFKALLIKEKSLMFSPPFSRSPIILVFFILFILLSQMILRWSCLPDQRIFSGTGSTDALKTSFEMPRDFTILTCFPKYLIYHVFSKGS